MALPLALALAACVTPTTNPPTVTRAQIEAEERRQRVLVLEHTREEQRRLDRIAYPLLLAAVPFCRDHAMAWPGFRPLSADAFPEEWRAAAREAYGLADTLQVFSVLPGSPAEEAGLQPGDRLVQVGDHAVGIGEDGRRALFRWLADTLPNAKRLAVAYRREGRVDTARLEMDVACPYETAVIPSMAINAFADGGGVYVTSAMMRFAEDHELAAVVAHETAHNAMGHIEAAMTNAAVAGLFGLLGDLAIILSGDTLPDETNTGYFMERGALAFSKDFEREADYVGLYILARAEADLERAPDIFRAFALAEPETVGYADTHPSHTERFLLMEATIREIREKAAAGEPLVPERKDRRGR